METKDLKDPVKNLFLSHDFEICDEHITEESFGLSFIKKDFRIEIYFYSEDNSYDLSLERPSFGFRVDETVSEYKEIESISENFIKKIDNLIREDEKLPELTKNDCELFLRTGGYDGLGSGVIEYKGSLYYFDSVNSNYHKDRSQEDRNNRVWRRYYVYEMDKQELEKVVLSSLDWIRHINLSSLCKDWKSMNINTGTEAEHRKHFDGKYRGQVSLKSQPVMKLTLYF